MPQRNAPEIPGRFRLIWIKRASLSKSGGGGVKSGLGLSDSVADSIVAPPLGNPISCASIGRASPAQAWAGSTALQIGRAHV